MIAQKMKGVRLKKMGLMAAFCWAVFMVASLGATSDPESMIQDPLVPTIRSDKGQDAFLRKHKENLERTKMGDVELLFLGDSITELWKTRGKEIFNQYYGAYKTANYGIGGDSTQNILWRIEKGELDGITPKVVVLMVGTNNSSAHSAEQIAASQAKIIGQIHEKSPKTQVLLLGVFPRGLHPTKPNPKETQLQQATIKELNILLGKLDRKPAVRYLDIGEKFLVNGKIPETIMPDQLHLSAEGYRIWAENMDPLLKEMLHEKISAQIYPRIDAPGYEYTDSELSIEVNGLTVPVRNYRPFNNELQSRDRNYYVAQLGLLGGNLNIKIDAKEPVLTWSISPKNYNIQGEAQGAILSFNLQESKYLAIRINQKNMLYLLVDPPETDRPSSSGIDVHSGKPVYNVRSSAYRADHLGHTLSTNALQKAIDDASQDANGGIVYFPAGVYMTHKLILKSRVWIYLEPGAVIMADSNRAHWSNEWEPDHILELIKTDDNTIYGRGVIYCQGVALKQQKIDGFNALRLRPIKLQYNNNLVIDGITANESTEWTIAVEGGSNILLTNIKVLNEKKWGTNDGIDICGGENIVVRHCFVSTMDDAYCVKGLFFGDVKNVLFDDIVADTTKDGFKIGMQGLTEVHDITVNNLHVIRCYKGIDLIHYYGTSNFRDCRFTNCRIEKVLGSASSSNRASTALRMIVHLRICDAYPNGVGSIYNIEVSNLVVDEPGPNPMILQGFDDSNLVRNIHINNSFMGDQKIDAVLANEYARNFVSFFFIDGIRVFTSKDSSLLDCGQAENSNVVSDPE